MFLGGDSIVHSQTNSSLKIIEDSDWIRLGCWLVMWLDWLKFEFIKDQTHQ